MFKVIKGHIQTVAEGSFSRLTDREGVTLTYALSAYIHVLPRTGEFTGQEWVDAIKQTYDEHNPHTAAVLDVIAKVSR